MEGMDDKELHKKECLQRLGLGSEKPDLEIIRALHYMNPISGSDNTPGPFGNGPGIPDNSILVAKAPSHRKGSRVLIHNNGPEGQKGRNLFRSVHQKSLHS